MTCHICMMLYSHRVAIINVKYISHHCQTLLMSPPYMSDLQIIYDIYTKSSLYLLYQHRQKKPRSKTNVRCRTNDILCFFKRRVCLLKVLPTISNVWKKDEGSRNRQLPTMHSPVISGKPKWRTCLGKTSRLLSSEEGARSPTSSRDILFMK